MTFHKPMPEGPQEPDTSKMSFRDSINWEWEVQRQIKDMNAALNSGNSKDIANKVKTTYMLLKPWIDPETVNSMDKEEFNPIGIESQYTPQDKEMLKEYGCVTKKRRKEIETRVRQINEVQFKKYYEKMHTIIMDVVKRKNLGFRLADTGIISWDKKKETTSDSG